MAQITAYCAEAQGLHLGPGVGAAPIKGELIVFKEGYAEFDDADYPDWLSWRAGAPHIEILDARTGEVAPTEPGAFVCDRHDPPKAFASQKALNGHLMSHRPGKSEAATPA